MFQRVVGVASCASRVFQVFERLLVGVASCASRVFQVFERLLDFCQFQAAQTAVYSTFLGFVGRARTWRRVGNGSAGAGGEVLSTSSLVDWNSVLSSVFCCDFGWGCFPCCILLHVCKGSFLKLKEGRTKSHAILAFQEEFQRDENQNAESY